MKKEAFIQMIKDEGGYATLGEARVAYESFLTCLTKAIEKNNGLTLYNFGTFEKKKRKARVGRHPRTGEQIAIPESTVLKFKPSAIIKRHLAKN